MRSCIFAILLSIAILGCGKKPSADKVTYVADDDPRMNAAIAKARSTVKTFIAALKSPKPGQSAFSIKMGFTDGGNTQQITWEWRQPGEEWLPLCDRIARRVA